MLGELAQYPRYVVAGYAKLPFPAIERAIMVDALGMGAVASESRVGYALPALYTAALLQALPITAFDPSSPVASIGSMFRRLVREPELPVGAGGDGT